ncbi:MAG: putative membrane protein YfcA [Granulosicoccus sp.]|jgi:uncharacterized membrane protein YfcA
MTVTNTLLLLGCGVIGGMWNAVAGGATLFTFPALMAVGLPPVVANATNYLALLPSNAAALPAYRKELREVGKALWPLIIISGFGAVVGSLLLMKSDPAVFMSLVPYLILLATCLFAFGKSLNTGLRRLAGESASKNLVYFALFLFSIYGGYFGAGLGIILLAIAQIIGYTEFHTANSIKNLLATSFTIISIVIFGLGGLIAWPEAVTMMLGSTVGGYIGGRYARRVNERYLSVVVVVFGLCLSMVYFYRS